MKMKNKSALIKKMESVSQRLEALYPDAECALHYGGDPWRLFIMARLSAQCTDKRVNEVSLVLFEKYPTAEALADGNIGDIEAIVRPCGLFHTKAANIKAASQKLISEYDGVIPKTMDELLDFPGVGRKIANLILGDIYGLPAVVCDTHCIRICGRLGFYPEDMKNAEVCEKILREVMDLERGSDFCHRIVEFGREICTAKSPKCEGCPMADLCEHLKGRQAE